MALTRKQIMIFTLALIDSDLDACGIPEGFLYIGVQELGLSLDDFQAALEMMSEAGFIDRGPGPIVRPGTGFDIVRQAVRGKRQAGQEDT